MQWVPDGGEAGNLEHSHGAFSRWHTLSVGGQGAGEVLS